MTRDKWAKLSPEEQRIKVHVCAGKCPCSEVSGIHGERCPDCGNLEGYDKRPDYLNDLNAMHEAEKLLKVYRIHKYCDNVDMIMAEDFVSGMCDINIMATAAQRAEAFVLTMEEE